MTGARCIVLVDHGRRFWCCMGVVAWLGVVGAQGVTGSGQSLVRQYTSAAPNDAVYVTRLFVHRISPNLNRA